MSADVSAPERPTPVGMRLMQLTTAAWIYAFGMAVHGSDHAMRGFRTDDHDHAAWPGPVQVFLGFATLFFAVTAVLLARSGQRWAPIGLAVGGLGSGFTFLGLHLAPEWGHVVDTFPMAGEGAHITGYSWVTMVIGVAGSFVLGVAAVRALKAGRAG